MPTTDHALSTLMRADYYIAKLMHKLSELVVLEYVVENPGESSRRCIQWLKLYAFMVKKYKDYIYEKADDVSCHCLSPSEVNKDYDFCGDELPEIYLEESSQWSFMLSMLQPKMYDRILKRYMDCHKFLVGPKAFGLVASINQSLLHKDNWAVFMSFHDMVRADGGLNQSAERTYLLSECQTVLENTMQINCEIENLPIVAILEKIRFGKKKVKVQVPDSSENVVETIYGLNQSAECKPVLENTMQINGEIEKVRFGKKKVQVPDSSENIVETVCGPLSRLTATNAKLGMIITYSTKRVVEYGKITAIKPAHVEITRLQKQSDGSFLQHKVAICKASQNKPTFQRLISIIM